MAQDQREQKKAYELKITMREVQVNLPGTNQALFRLNSFEVKSGQHILIQGESGRGKTTLLHLIAGLFRPHAGSVEVGEFKMTEASDERRCEFRRAHIGIIFQKLNLLEHLTARENVALATDAQFAQRIDQALDQVRLTNQKDLRSSVLSLGEQQRVAVARVLAAGAQVILADEPTSSLDAKNALTVMGLIREAARGKTLLVVSHDHRLSEGFDQIVQFEKLVTK